MMKKLLFLFLLIPFGLSAQIIPPLNDSTAIGTPGAAYTPSIRVVTYGGKTLFQVRVGTSAKWMTMSTTQYDRNYVQLNGGNSITGSQSIFGNVSINNGSLQSTINGASWSSPNGNIINLADGGAFVDLNIKSSNSVKIVSRHNAQPGTDRTIEFKGDSIIKSSTGKNALFEGDVASFTALNFKLDSVYQRTLNLYTTQSVAGDKTFSGTVTANSNLITNGSFFTYGNVSFRAPGTMFEVQGGGYGIGAVNGNTGNNIGLDAPKSALLFGITSSGILRQGLLKWDNLTANQTIQFPDASGTVALTSDISAGYVPYTGATGNITSTFAISAKNYSATGTAGTGYYDVISQATSPASASGHLRIYSDSLNRLSWKNSTYRRTLQVPFPSDVTVRFPYKSTPTLADSTDVSNVYLKKSDSTLFARRGGNNTFTAQNTFTNGIRTSGNFSKAYSDDGFNINVADATYTDLTSSGSVTNLRSHRIGIPTFNATNPTTYSNAATLTIEGEPIQGTNAIFTTKSALDISSGFLNLRNNARLGVNIGNNVSPSAVFHIGSAGGAFSTAGAWAANGFGMRVDPMTYTSTSATTSFTDVGVYTFGTPTLASANTTTITNGSSLTLQGAPTAGTNTTITNAYALRIINGMSLFGGNTISATRHGVGSSAAPQAFLHLTGTTYTTGAQFGNNGLGIRQDAATYNSTSTTASLTAGAINSIAIPTVTNTAISQTIGSLSTFKILGAPVAGTGMTITNPYAFEVAAGASLFSGSIRNTTIAASLPVFTDGNSTFVSNAITGTGSVVMSTGATLTNIRPATTFQSATGSTADSLSFVNAQRHVSKALVAGAGVSINQTASTVTISTAPNVVEISGTSQAATGNTIYIPHNVALTTITIPTTTTIGTLYQVVGEGSGGWKFVLPTGGVAVGVGGFTTTSGGSISSTDRYCTLTIRYAATNKFVVTTSQGTLTPL